MSEKQPVPTKDELRRMLAQAVLNTPGASRLEPVREAKTRLVPEAAPKGAAKSRQKRRSPNTKSGRIVGRAKRR
jgi:hypothetical protein